MTWRAVVILFLAAGALAPEDKMVKPRYSEDNQLLRPEGYREWIFVGANLGMGYSEAGGGRKDLADDARFHNIYIQPEAYRHFAARGEFPDNTMLVMEVLSAGTNVSINRQGRFADRFIGIEVALKDVKRFPEKWAYFDFIGKGGAALPKAKPFPKEACWSCHNEHGAADNVFLQFYPVLRAVWKQQPRSR